MVCRASGRLRSAACPSSVGASPMCTSAEWLSESTKVEKSIVGSSSLELGASCQPPVGFFGSPTFLSIREGDVRGYHVPEEPPDELLPNAGCVRVTLSALAAESGRSLKYLSTSFSSSTPLLRLRSRTRTSRSQG